MEEPTQFLNGQWTNRASLVLSVEDLGALQGVAVSERLRTFAGKVFRVNDHLQRLQHSLEIIGLDSVSICRQIEQMMPEVVARNLKSIDGGDDLAITLFITPGAATPVGQQTDFLSPQPTVCIYAQPLPFADWADAYDRGERLVVSHVQQVPARCWPPELKCRSRMHYYLADRDARERDPRARALLLDERGFVCEASTANVIVVRDGAITSPCLESILPGVSLTAVRALAEELGIRFTFRDITPDDVIAADEVLLASTSSCLLPVTAFDRQSVGRGAPGPMFHRLLDAWSRQVGVAIAEQARRFRKR